MYTWNQTWIKANESPWSLTNKFMIANCINGSLAAKELINTSFKTPNSSYKYGYAGIISKYKIKNEVKDNEHLNLLSHGSFLMDNLTSFFTRAESRFYSKDDICNILLDSNLCYCPICITSGHHSLRSQLIYVTNCEIHKVSLESTCPQCGKLIPFEINFDTSPFSCPNCNLNFITQDFGNLIDNWTNNSFCKETINDFKLYKNVIPFIITNSDSGILNDSKFIDTIREMYSNHYITAIARCHSKRCNEWGTADDSYKSIPTISNITYAYQYALKVVYRRMLKKSRNRRGVYSAEKLNKFCPIYTLMKSNEVSDLIRDNYNIEGLILYLWKRDLEEQNISYAKYFLNQTREGNKQIHYNKEISMILTKIDGIISNMLPDKYVRNILIQVGIYLFINRFEKWNNQINNLCTNYSPQEILKMMNSLVLKKESKSEFKLLILVEENTFEYKIFFYDDIKKTPKDYS